MNWNTFCGAVGDMDDAYMQSLGSGIGNMSEDDVFDMFAVMFGYPL